MLKLVARLEHRIGDRIFHLICDSDSPISEVKDALVQFLSHASSIEKSAIEALKSQEEQPAIQPDAVEEQPKSE